MSDPTPLKGPAEGFDKPKARNESMSASDIPPAPKTSEYAPDEIVLYGIQLYRNDTGASIPFNDDKRLVIKVYDTVKGKPVKAEALAVAAIYSYSFEGSCYRFDKPKLLVFDGESEEAVGCGYNRGTEYKMWRTSSKKMMMELIASVDLAEKLVLEANLPGNRSPNTYGNDMQLAHRGNRLSKTGGTY